ncbi:MAG: type I pullulanase, partial [Bacteroidetes bacterium]
MNILYAPTFGQQGDYPVYEGDDLGIRWSPERTVLRVWAPSADALVWHLYGDDLGDSRLTSVPMQRDTQGTWVAAIEGDQQGRYYTVQARFGDRWSAEVPDPWVRATGANGLRGMIFDPADTRPEEWSADQRPPLDQFEDIIIYELHLRDISVHPASGIRHKGKFLGLAETGTTTPAGTPTGLDHIADLGVTHVHILPMFDFASLDETRPEPGYNWGYDPQNYNVPEGTYATDPHDGRVRMREMKTMVQALHRKGLRVIMDVVYNHMFDAARSSFEQLVPGYFFRHDADGSYSNASGCGNETASERPMMRKFIVESVRYWATEYHIDGFRFDLMAIHDLETMRAVRQALDQIDPTIFVYGEGWTAGASPLPDSLRALKANIPRLPGIAAFSDEVRDAIKGHVFTHDDPGFASGKPGLKESIKFGLVAAGDHPEVDYASVNYSRDPWTLDPAQCIVYASCHDNHTLWDRLALSRPDQPEAVRQRMQMLALTIVLTSQGVPFLHAGSEMLRTKYGVENSFESPDTINQIDWLRLERYPEVHQYVRALIALR